MTPLPFNPALKDLPVYQPGRPIEEAARELGVPPEEIVKLASNENPLGPSPKALAAMQKACARAHLYPDGNAYYLKRKLAERLDLDPGNLILGNGSNEIIEFVGHALMRPECSVVFSQYAFAVYPIVTKLFGATPIEVPAKAFGHDLNAMRKSIRPDTAAVFVANPNNPTGTLAPRGDLIEFVNEVPENVLIVLDEAYFEFLTHPVDFLPLIRRGDKPNLLLMRTFSKIHGLAGLRIGYGIGRPELIGPLEKVRQPFNLNAIAQAGALAALDDDEHLAKTKANNQAGLEFLYLELRKLGVEYVKSHANFLLIKTGDGAATFKALHARGVIARPTASYGLPEWIRVSVGTGAENHRFLSALKETLDSGFDS